MKRFFIASAALMSMLVLSSSSLAQGSALGGVLNTADKLQQDIKNRQDPITAGPKDKYERVSPGKIDADASRKFTTTETGLRYRILRNSSKRKPKSTDGVVAHYKGWLDSKKIFDSSYRKGRPIPFPLDGVIPGWTEGLQLIGEGGMIELDIPHKLGYGEQGRRGVIPPKARLHFIVELVSIQ